MAPDAVVSIGAPDGAKIHQSAPDWFEPCPLTSPGLLSAA